MASIGIGFAIPIDMVKHSVEQLTQHGKISRPSLGKLRSEHLNASAARVFVWFVSTCSFGRHVRTPSQLDSAAEICH
eukprot:COSAG02_NODE_5733_length_4083_cov_1.905371_3_plen_77_part_00